MVTKAEQTAVEKQELKSKAKALQRKIDHLERQLGEAKAPVTNTRIYADELRSKFGGGDKASFIEYAWDELVNMFNYVDKDKREYDPGGAYHAGTNIRVAAEEWSISRIGNRWLLNAMSLHNYNQTGDAHDKDFIELELVHLGYLRQDHGILDATSTPDAVNISMTVRIHRYEIRG